MASLSEAWGDPEMYLPPDMAADEPSLSLEQMHDLPGYSSLMGSPYCVSRPNQRGKNNPSQKHSQTQQPLQSLPQQLLPFDPSSHTEILNALLYIVSGIYLIYTMDMFMRMGMSVGR